MPRPPLLGAVALALLALAGCGKDDPPARAAPDPAPAPDVRRAEPDSTALARSLARQIARPWPKLQDRYGRFTGNVRGYTRYGEAVLGQGLIQVGLRERNRRMVASGIKAVTYAVEAFPFQKLESNFENLGVTLAYQVAEERLRRNPRYRKVRSRWQDFLRRVRLTRLPIQDFYGNHWLVEAVYVLELQRTGLRSSDPQAILGGDRQNSRSLAEGLINRRLQGLMASETVVSGGEPTLLLSDPPENPLPYQGLSLGMYARALKLLGRRATPAARELLRRSANASWRLAAPDGDVGYWGRNQGQAFAQSFTAYGARMNADLPGVEARRDRRMEALARRTLVRLREAYVGGRYGMFIVPSLRGGATAAALAGLDASAGVPSFTGLALMALNWSLERSDRGRERRRPAGRLHADRDGASVLGTGPSQFVTVRRGDDWFVVKAGQGLGRIRDLRFDFGLDAYKRRRPDGAWRDVIPLKPYTDVRPDSAGPVLDPRGARALPYADDIRVGRRGRVTVVGGWRDVTGAPVRTGVRFLYEPSACGVRLSWPARPGDAFELSAFVRRSPRSSRARTATLRAGDQKLRVAPRAALSLQRRYSSASDAQLVRAHLRWGPARRGRWTRVTYCAR